jgi:opacity protein-like surface antigen
MKKVSVIVLVVVGLLFAAYAEAAKPKRRSRNANRIGPYAGALISMNNYPGDQSAAEEDIGSTFDGVSPQNLQVGTDDSDVGFAAQFGYRFTRYIAVEFALAQYGDLRSRARADIDLDDGNGVVPASINLAFHSGGPQLSAIGILPLNNKFELYGRAGLLFASSEREFVIRVDGDTNSFGRAKGESTEVVFGVGAAYHVNQMFSVRAQYEKLDKVGDPNRTGTEDISSASIGLIVRF